METDQAVDTETQNEKFSEVLRSGDTTPESTKADTSCDTENGSMTELPADSKTNESEEILQVRTTKETPLDDMADQCQIEMTESESPALENFQEKEIAFSSVSENSVKEPEIEHKSQSGDILPVAQCKNSLTQFAVDSENVTCTLVKSDGDDLLAEVDMELSGNEYAVTPSNVNGKSIYDDQEEGDNSSKDTAKISEYQKLREKNEELLAEQERMKLEISRLNNSLKESGMKLSSSDTDIYIAQIKKLEATISSQQAELQQTRNRLASHDASAKKAVATLQNELHSFMDKVKILEEDAVKEKEKMTIKYAQAEQKNILLQQSQNRLELQMKDMLKEREVMIARFKAIKVERQKLQELYDSRVAEISVLRKELEKEKEVTQTFDMKLKWHQNKLKAESDTNKELKLKMEDLQRKLKEAKEETEIMRNDYHKMIKTYQESDEIRSNSLEKEVKVKEEKLQQHMQERTDQTEVHMAVVKELDMLKKKHRDTIEELKTLKDKVTCLEAERITQEHTLDKFKETLQNQKYENKQLTDKLAQLEITSKQLTSAETRVKQLEAELVELQEANREILVDMESCSMRESEHLAFSQKISDKNAQLQSENNSLSHKLSVVMEEQQRLTKLCEVLEEKAARLEKDLEEEKHLRLEDVQSLTSSLETKSRAVEELSRTIEEEKDEYRTLKRKHNAYTKDLLRQLHQARKRLEAYEQNHAPSDSLSLGSRTSSTGSLDTLGNSGAPANNQTGNFTTNPAAGTHEAVPHQEEAPPVVEVVEVDKQMLMDKIVRLQKAHARKNEKIEFMEDHINQLVADIQKKTRIIQHYLMLEETGSLSPEFMDKHKAQLAKKGGIMASLYNSQSQDGTMTLDLSLEINHKLQAVLEDILLKNMTYKDNLLTLGEEISHLSQENRRLQLQLMKQSS